MSNGQTSNLYVSTLTVNGVVVPGSWDKKTGGAPAAQETKYRPGGSPTQVSLGGPVNVDNVTLERLFVRERDLDLLALLMPLVGTATVVVTQQTLDQDYLPFGQRITYTGRLNKVSVPDMDSNSQAASMISLEVSTQGTVAIA